MAQKSKLNIFSICQNRFSQKVWFSPNLVFCQIYIFCFSRQKRLASWVCRRRVVDHWPLKHIYFQVQLWFSGGRVFFLSTALNSFFVHLIVSRPFLFVENRNAQDKYIFVFQLIRHISLNVLEERWLGVNWADLEVRWVTGGRVLIGLLSKLYYFSSKLANWFHRSDESSLTAQSYSRYIDRLTSRTVLSVCFSFILFQEKVAYLYYTIIYSQSLIVFWEIRFIINWKI